MYDCLYTFGAFFVGVLLIRALLLGVFIRDPDFVEAAKLIRSPPIQTKPRMGSTTEALGSPRQRRSATSSESVACLVYQRLGKRSQVFPTRLNRPYSPY